MSYRRSPGETAAARGWRRFTGRNAALVDAAGLPPGAVETRAAWDGPAPEDQAVLRTRHGRD